MRQLVGRDAERAAIGHLLDEVRSGLSAVLVLRGEAGVGKTGLLEAAVADAGEFEIVRLLGVESEMRLGFAGLYTIVGPFLWGIDAIPARQARALRTAFGMVDDDPPDPFLVGLAALSLLSHAASGRPILVVVDDAQWLDTESAVVLGFVARRVYADRIGILIAVRDPSDRAFLFDQLPFLRVEALEEDASRELLGSWLDGPLAEHVRARIVADSRGNPLALVELSRELSTEQRVGSEPLPEALPVDQRLEASFLRQLRGLPPNTQKLLLVVAAEPTGDLELVLRAGSRLGFDERALDAAVDEDLITIGPPVRFRHPLIRSALYHGAVDRDRRRTHEVLAEVTEDTDPDRQAWHRACAATAPDEVVAAELEAAAGRARSRGGYAASASMLGRAAQLTPDPTRRAVRFLASAAADLTAGNSAGAYASLQQALPHLEEPLIAAQARRLEAAILFMNGSNGAADRFTALHRHDDVDLIMLDAARSVAPLDLRSARDMLMDALLMAVYLSESTVTSGADVARVALATPLPADVAPVPADLVLDAIAELVANGYADAVPLLRSALHAVRTDPAMRDLPRPMFLACWIAFALGDDDVVQALAAECGEIGRERGALQLHAEALNYLGQSHLRLGSLAQADACFAEEVEVHALFQRLALGEAVRLVVAAWHGRAEHVRTEAPALADRARGVKLGLVASLADYAVVVLELGLGDYRAAAAPPLGRHEEDVSLGAFRAADAIEAHVRGGDLGIARDCLAWLASRAQATRSPLDLGLHARSAALLSVEEEAERHFLDALAHFTTGATPLHRARAQLLYGEWLRRVGRRRDARAHLEAAIDVFDAARVVGFAERGRIELRATGARARKRIDETRDDLTPQEAQIARLAAAGSTNAEIASRLVISTSTVDYHLRKVYRKLDVSSRRDLVRRLPSTA